MKLLCVLISINLYGCAALNYSWYKPGISQQEFAQDRFGCMSGSQMQVSTANVNATGPTYRGVENTTCNTYGWKTNCSSEGGYSQPGAASGSSESYTTTNAPLFQACMQARGYAWTNQADLGRYEVDQQTERDTAAHAEYVKHVRDWSTPGPSGAAAAGITKERYAAAQARCRALAGDDQPLCNELNANDVTQSEAIAAKSPL